MFNNLKENRGNGMQVIFTPDRMTLQIEEKLFDELGEKCFFDVDVTTLTRFTNKIISKHNYNFKVLSKPVAVAIVKKILTENKSQLKTMRKATNFNGFASILFDTISMFKSCNVNVDQISNNTKNNNLNLKLDDLKLVYKNYEEFLKNEYTDSFNKLNLLAKLLKSEDFKNTHFYFVGFDDFTPQMYNIIQELVKVSASVNIATAVNYIDDLNNKNIFLNNVYLNLLNLANINGIKYNKIYCKASYTNEFEIISNNLFGMKLLKSDAQSNCIKLHKFNDVTDEIVFAIKQIQYLIASRNVNYNDFVIITPSLADYKTKLQTLFTKNNIPYFFDESELVSNSIVLRFYFDLFELVTGNFSKRDLLNFLRNYSEIDFKLINLFENVVNKSGYNYQKLLVPIQHLQNEELQPVYQLLTNFISLREDLKTVNTLGGIVDILSKFTEMFGFKSYLSKLSNKYKEKNNVIEYNKLNNVISKVNKGFKEIVDVLGNYQIDCSEAFDIIKAYFENLTVVIPPILSESVIVTDILKGELPKKKFAIILGAAEGKMPVVQNDLGLITDQDINLLSNHINLSPTVNVINKRNKFKVYETMLKYEHIYLSYVAVTPSGEKIMPSELISNLQTMFSNLQLVNGSLILHEYQNELTNNYFEFNNINASFVTTNFIENLKTEMKNSSVIVKRNTNNMYEALTNSNQNVEKYIDNIKYVNNVPNLENTSLFLKNNKVSVSEIEKYYNCPFEHFVKYGLKLSEIDSSEFDARLFGNILHEYTKKIVPYLQSSGENNLKEFSLKTLDSILKKDEYKHLVLNPNNSNNIKSLKREVLRINTALLRLQNSETLTTENDWLEKRCDGFVLDNGKVKIELQGVIDRVDFDNDTFAIIDYKTGESDFSNFTDIASGKKLQLIVYVYIVQNLIKKRPIGVFYMPLKNTYTKQDNDELYKLKGAVSTNLSDICKIDKNLHEPSYSSKVTYLKTKKDGGIDVRGKILLSNQDFETLVDYTTKMVLSAVENIKNGCIKPEPLKIGNKTACDYCEYKAMCNFSEDYENKYREFGTIRTIEGLKTNDKTNTE